MKSEEVIEFLGDVPLLQRLPSSSIRKISQLVIVRNYDSGEYVYREGEPGGGVYFIWEGEMEVSSSFHADNHGYQVFQCKKFDHFSQSESVGQADVVALTKLTCLMLPHKHRLLLQSKSIWSADVKLETCSPVEHILNLEPLDVNVFRGFTFHGAPKSAKVYGGQFMGQAVAAASKTVHFLKILHSFHAHFLLPGDISIPIIYQVHRLRDVPNLATRRVNAVQKERVVFFLIASFQRGEDGFDHQGPIMPSMPDPGTLLPKHGLEEGRTLDHLIPRTEVCTSTSVPWPTEIRPCDSDDYSPQTTRPPRLNYWLRAKGKLSDDQALHRCVAAYFSDLLFVQVSLNPHRRKDLNPSSLSLDHSMWFHRDLRADDWLLNVIVSPTAYNARGFCRGQMFNRKGELVLSANQVGVVRKQTTPLSLSSSTASKL